MRVPGLSQTVLEPVERALPKTHTLVDLLVNFKVPNCVHIVTKQVVNPKYYTNIQ